MTVDETVLDLLNLRGQIMLIGEPVTGKLINFSTLHIKLNDLCLRFTFLSFRPKEPRRNKRFFKCDANF